MATLLASHVWEGSFQAFMAASGGSSGGGVVLGVHKRLVRLFPQRTHMVIAVGRAHAVGCLATDGTAGLLVINVHLEPAATSAAKRAVLAAIAALASGENRCMLIAMGDWNPLTWTTPASTCAS